MNDEIKEILDNFEKYEARYKLHNETQFIITHREIEPLLDYITTLQHQISLMEEDIRESKEINGELQQENEYLKKQNDEKAKIGIADHKYASQMEDKVIELQQENKEYKEYVKELKDSLRSYHIKNNKLINENERLKEEKQRLLYNLEKASEYIKEHYPTSTINDQDDKYNLLNILQNGSEKVELIEYLKLIREKGEFDFEVSAKILDLMQEEYDELRAMLVVAIGTMEEMWRNEPIDVKVIKNKETKWK